MLGTWMLLSETWPVRSCCFQKALWPRRQCGRDTGHGQEWLHNALAQKSVHREGYLHSPGGININFLGEIYLLQRYGELTELKKIREAGRASLRRDRNSDLGNLNSRKYKSPLNTSKKTYTKPTPINAEITVKLILSSWHLPPWRGEGLLLFYFILEA